MIKIFDFLKMISETNLMVVASSKSQDVSFKDYLLVSSSGGFRVYNIDFFADDVIEIIVDRADIRIKIY